jgi:hypothetical protein
LTVNGKIEKNLYFSTSFKERGKNISSWLFFLLFLLKAAGLHPTAEQIEMFAYHLPETTLSNLIVSGNSLFKSLLKMLICHTLNWFTSWARMDTLPLCS